MDGSVIFVNSSLNLHAVSQLPLAVSALPQTVVVQLSFSCLSSVSHQSLISLSSVSQQSLSSLSAFSHQSLISLSAVALILSHTVGAKILRLVK